MGTEHAAPTCGSKQKGILVALLSFLLAISTIANFVQYRNSKKQRYVFPRKPGPASKVPKSHRSGSHLIKRQMNYTRTPKW